jgi:hypothetical protein
VGSLRAAIAILALSVAAIAVPRAQGPGDGEVRTGKDPATGDTLTTLTLLLSNEKGPLSIRMGFTKIQRVKPATTAQGDMRIDVDMRLVVGIPDYRDPQLQMTLDRGTKKVREENHSVEPGVNMRAQNQLSIMFSSAALARLASATKIDGRLFGVEFTLTPRQLQAIQRFAGSR